MHLAKVITLSVLSIVSAVNISCAEQLAPPNIQDSKSFTGVDQSALKKENVATNEKENNDNNNGLKAYGPLTICSDRAFYDGNQGTLIYTGNVFVMQVHNQHILCHKPKKLKKSSEYFTRDKSYSFKQLQEKWMTKAKKICAKQKECNFISGQKLTIQLTQEKKIKTLVMDSEGIENSEFYTYPIDANSDFSESKKVTKGPLKGNAKQVTYDIINKDLYLHRQAVVNQNQNQYKGDKIIYDIEHDLINIPGSKQRRSNIILDGVEKQTKINTGLPTITK
ncbi:LptA/OstA family protein [Francisella adeliensis]|uniref:Organic solvent tolerance-like N-terminal domain-containing protein n=1 Tax=Francisella adeliensis TaxID=2007306 RepID=A0A2Z4XZG5_9GAMM|nr:LptA/OstA family protein [Francisella adeliensis]AXA33823.1 hypothetical protein CDH04_05065 [Francisella adeliensis]MBK2085724.1 hypothetical protein [Francisella adeliensis]MBK2097602.1 hypothetical protein [Francisella adeliensis]QIW12060.1 hypothetical protein FZC43_05070 [Francisella adeliensis]QIW13934.1 hypothetical protein FZC44_05070 [Francisella adeliensis]